MLFSIFIFGYAICNVEFGFMQYKIQSNFQDYGMVFGVYYNFNFYLWGFFFSNCFRQNNYVRCLFMGMFLISLMVVFLTISVEFTPQEQKTYEKIKKR